MNSDQEYRLQLLADGPCVPVSYLRDYYGVTVPLTGDAAAAFEQYSRAIQRPTQCPQGQHSRFQIEGFMVRASLLAKKWMGARLGMTAESLDRVLSSLPTFGLLRSRYEVTPELVADSLHDDLLRVVPGLRFRTSGNHSAFCERLHAEIRKVGVTVEPLFCHTSTRMREYPRLYAMHFDCLTLEPLSTKHSAWLDFRKPLNLPPDRCSRLFYVENRNELRQFAAGTTEPDDLDEYEGFLGGDKHV